MDETLLLLAKDVRGKTLRLLEGLSDEQARFAAPGLCNTILWHAGHALTVVEHLGVCAITGAQPSYPAGWFETFSSKSNPATITKWPSVEEVRTKLIQQLEKITTAIAQLSEQQLQKIVDAARGRTLRYSIMHGFHDEANHQGEMWLLRKMSAAR
jgi:hypothetical protein